MSKETEVIIVGGGIAGLSAAGQLTKSGIKVGRDSCWSANSE